MALCMGAILEKRRFKVRRGNALWEIDVYEGANDGLVVADRVAPARG